jgi:ferredoxin
MSTEIYYFTGTGNSLAVARDLAEKLKGQLRSIPSVMDRDSIQSAADVIGIVFPVYYAALGGSGIPFIVERFVKKLKNLDSKYIFAVCTHGGGPVRTIECFGEMIRAQGGKLSAGFAVKMSNPYTVTQKLQHVLSQKKLETNGEEENEKREKIVQDWQEKLEDICQAIAIRKAEKFENQGKIGKKFLNLFYAFQNKMALQRYQTLAGTTKPTLEELIPLADTSFSSDPNCAGCGTCVKVCPVDNIRLVNHRPVWQHHCETCFACFQWCPKEAIHGDIVEYEKRYHHPGVKLKDMLT